MILASNKDKLLSWDDFLDAIDNDPSIIAQLNTITSETLGKDNLFTQPEDSDEKKVEYLRNLCYLSYLASL